VTRLLLWRHGLTDWNASGRVQGQLNSDLSDVGRGQAEAAAGRLSAYHPDLLISSDLRRAADTAGALSAVTGLDIEYDVRLRERHHGVWQGLTGTEIAARWPEEYERWRAGLPVRGLGVEDLDEVGKRMVDALQDAAARAPGGTVVLVSHGAAIRRSVGAMLGWPEPVVRALGAIGNCHWVELRLSDLRRPEVQALGRLCLDAKRGWQLRAYNAG
jgi:glucosyl-3-phosphoglycerate phosphatase